MYILLTASTYNEINSTIEWLKKYEGMIMGNELEVLITGIGGTATAYALTRQLLWRTPELVIQAGIGGSYKEKYPPEKLVLISEEVFADLGATDDEAFSDIFDMGLTGNNEQPFTNRMLVNPGISAWMHVGLPFVRGATINCISSTPEQVDRIRKKYDPVIESMEGAALHYACIMEHIPFIQLRAVSNFAGERDKNKWKMKESIAALNTKLKELIERIDGDTNY